MVTYLIPPLIHTLIYEYTSKYIHISLFIHKPKIIIPSPPCMIKRAKER